MKYSNSEIPYTQKKSRQYNKTFTDSSCVSTPEYQPYYDLWCEVIKQAIRDKDIEFFTSIRFPKVCDLVGINSKAILYNLPSWFKSKKVNNE